MHFPIKVQGRGEQLQIRYQDLSFGALASLTIWLLGPLFIDVMTINPEVRDMARHYLPWAGLTPVLGAACFLYDGIFTGAMATRDMRNMMIVSLVIYLASSHVLENAYGNHGLWAALCIFLIVRSISFALRLPARSVAKPAARIQTARQPLPGCVIK